MRREQLEYAAAKYGTPLYIFDLDMLKIQVNRLKKTLGEGTGLCYAMKANPFLTREMAGSADRIEVCSMGEFEIFLYQECSRRRRIFSGFWIYTEKNADTRWNLLNRCIISSSGAMRIRKNSDSIRV